MFCLNTWVDICNLLQNISAIECRVTGLRALLQAIDNAQVDKLVALAQQYGPEITRTAISQVQLTTSLEHLQRQRLHYSQNMCHLSLVWQLGTAMFCVCCRLLCSCRGSQSLENLVRRWHSLRLSPRRCRLPTSIRDPRSLLARITMCVL